MNATFLSWFLNVVKINLKMSKGVSLILYVNTKGYKVSEYIATYFKVNTLMLSRLNKKNPIEV